MKQRNAMTQARTYEDDVMTEERTIPMIGLAPMPHLAPKRRLARKPIKRVMPKPKPEVVEVEEEEEEKYDLYESLREAFAEVKLMMEGKMPKQSIEEVIAEMRLERKRLDREDELRNSIRQKV